MKWVEANFLTLILHAEHEHMNSPLMKIGTSDQYLIMLTDSKNSLKSLAASYLWALFFLTRWHVNFYVNSDSSNPSSM